MTRKSKTVTLWILAGLIAILMPQLSQVTIPPAFATVSDTYSLTVSSENHTDYGLSYPVTYIFNISASVTSAKVYYRYDVEDAWTALPIKTTDDFFNGIDAVRFNYATDHAFVSVAFSNDTDTVFLKFTDSSEDPIEATFSEIAKYYDNRTMVVTATADDWNGNATYNTAFIIASYAFRMREMWLTAGVTTNKSYDGTPYPPIWADIQAQINLGYVEIACHGANHEAIPYDDYDFEIGESKANITGNLDLPDIYKKGTTEYVYAWLEPYGQSDNAVMQNLSAYKYLVPRDVTWADNDFQSWWGYEDIYSRTGYTFRMGSDGAANSENATFLNELFDACYSSNEIYHLMFHPIKVTWESGYATQHLDHISCRKDVWYVGFGALYLYHYVDDQNAVSVAFSYTFKGVFDEQTGFLTLTGVNVTAYFSDGAYPDTFEVNGTVHYPTNNLVLYFLFNFTTNPRQYFPTASETGSVIYIFSGATTVYTIKFIDLAGVLDDYPIIEARRRINGTLHIIERRKVDVENKIQMALIQGQKYTIEIKNGTSYTFGDLLFTSTTTITLFLKGVEFPHNIILAYRYVRIWGYRHNNQSSVSIIFEEVESKDCDVEIDIQWENHTSVSGTYPYTYNDVTSFNHTWASATFNTTYVVQATITHPDYGELYYNTILARGFGSAVWDFPLGTIPNLVTAHILPLCLIFGSFLIFSRINAYVAAFVGVAVAILLSWWNWIPISPAYLIAALVFAILLAMSHKKKEPPL